MTDHDPINPAHYDGDTCMRMIATMGFALPFCLGTAVKYLWRAGRKQGATLCEDIGKAFWYLDWLEQHLDALPERQAELFRKPNRVTDTIIAIRQLGTLLVDGKLDDARSGIEELAFEWNISITEMLEGRSDE